MPIPALRQQTSVAARLVLTADDFRQVHTLRHEAYADAGYLQPNAASVFADDYDTRPSSRTVLLFRDDAPAATVRLCLLAESAEPDRHDDLGGDSLPATRMFGREIDAYIAARRSKGLPVRTVEITRLARLPNYERDLRLMQALFRATGYLILSFDADVIMATVTRSHTPYYRRMGFNLLVEPRAYPGLAVKTALMACETRNHAGVPGFLSSLGTLSIMDSTYQSLMQGRTVDIEPEPQRVPAVTAAASAQSVFQTT